MSKSEDKCPEAKGRREMAPSAGRVGGFGGEVSAVEGQAERKARPLLRLITRENEGGREKEGGRGEK